MISVLFDDAFKGQQPRFYDQNIANLQNDLQKYVEMMGERLKKRYEIDHYTYKLLEAGADQVYVYGRIYTGFQEDDQDEKLTEKNVEIQFVPEFDIHKLKFEYQKDVIPGLFRGQIIAACGVVDTKVFHASQIFTDCRISDPTTLPENFHARIIAASGPYESGSFDLCEELNEKIKSYNPDLVIFFGPFATEKSKMLNSTEYDFTALELTEEIINRLGKDIDNAAFIPSKDDLLSVPKIPRPSLPVNTDHFLQSDPTFITFQHALQIAATANDIQMLISQQYTGPGQTRRTEIPKQIAHQCGACPVMDVHLQNKYLSTLVPDFTPHIFLVSTKIFSKLDLNVDGTHVIYVKQEGKKLNFTVINVNENEITSEDKTDFCE